MQVRPVLPVTFSIDHRYVDAAQLGQALAAFREYLADPAAFEPALARVHPEIAVHDSNA